MSVDGVGTSTFMLKGRLATIWKIRIGFFERAAVLNAVCIHFSTVDSKQVLRTRSKVMRHSEVRPNELLGSSHTLHSKRWNNLTQGWKSLTTNSTPTISMAEYDITEKMIPFIDKHLAFPVLTHLLETSLFPEEDVRAAQYELAKTTNMVDFTVQLFQQLYPDEDIPQGLPRWPLYRHHC